MKIICAILLALLSINRDAPDLYASKNARISIFSHALIEDIRAVSQTGISVYNPATGELNFSLPISSLQFAKAFMQQHFNSDYMESDKYPRAVFKGKVQEHIDLTKDGSYPVNVTGELTVHGITKTRTVQGSISIKNGTISMVSEFIVQCSDHHIDIPQILFYHIAENIKVNVSATYNLYTNTPNKTL
ncbi:MAG TPA: YceI family protein [Mucilaginibacter sp.]|jgi:hypothetical protein|nr:YceI family protein [Mucilaginibacter sp.]